jgi:2'-5' RNA ligase
MEPLEATGVRPRQVRYQAALRPDYHSIINAIIENGLRVTFVTTPKRWGAPAGRARTIIFPSEVMPSSRYALVTYVRNPVGEFVEQLRRELHPTTAHMAAHLTILPPRELTGSEAAALEFLEEACSRVIPFSVELGDVETFLPTTPTVFIQVKRAAYRMRELHDQLCGKGLGCVENWPYVPHLTIVKTEQDEQARVACVVARERWAQFPGRRQVHVEELMFVRENGDCWQDVAPVLLGRGQLSAKS